MLTLAYAIVQYHPFGVVAHCAGHSIIISPLRGSGPLYMSRLMGLKCKEGKFLC